MAILALGGMFSYPDKGDVLGGISTTLTIDAGAEMAASIVILAKAGEIDTVGMFLGACSVNAASKIRVGLQTVGEDGNPTGTYWDGGIAYVDVDGSTLTQNAWNIFTIPSTTIVEADIGKLIAIVVEYGLKTSTLHDGFTAGDSIVVNCDNRSSSVPCVALYVSSWTRYSRSPYCALIYAGTVYQELQNVYPYSAALAILNVKSDTSGSAYEIGNRITVDYTCRCAGFWVQQTTPAGNWEVHLYDGTTSLTNIVCDKDEGYGSGGMRIGLFASPQTLVPGHVYRIVLKPSATTYQNCRPHEYTVGSAGLMNAMPYGTRIYESYRTDAGAWTDVNTKRISIGLLIDGIDIPVASGGGPLVGLGGLVS